MLPPGPDSFTRADASTCARALCLRRAASPVSEGTGEGRALGDAMADDTYTLTDGRLEQLAAGLREWLTRAGPEARDRAYTTVVTELKGLGFSFEDVLSLVVEVQQHRAPALDALVQQARERLAEAMRRDENARAESWARVLVTLLRCEDKPERAEPPRVSGPGLKQETLSTGNEMVANATRERLRHEVSRLAQGVTDADTGTAEVLRLADQLHALAVGTPPAPPPERLAKLEAVAEAARATHCGVSGGQQRLEDALRALDGVR